MTIRDYLSVIRQRILVVMITVVLTTSMAVLLQLRSTPKYTAKSNLLVVPLALTGAGEELSTKYQFSRGVATEAEIVKSTEVAKRVIARLSLSGSSLGRPDKLIDNVQVIPLGTTDVLEIAVTAPDPKLSSDLANTFPEEYIAFRREQAIRDAQLGSENIGKQIAVLLTKHNEIDVLQKGSQPGSSRFELLESQRRELIAQMASLELTRQKLIDQSPLKERGVGDVLKYATPPKGRSKSDIARTGILGLIIGIPLSLGIALLLDAMSDTIKTKEEAERIVGAEALGVIPLSPEWRSSKPYVVTREAPYSGAAEAFRTLRINLDSRVITEEGRQILFTSPGAGEGKTLTTANLGVAFAEAGRSALMVSADLRRPRLHQMFSVDASPGLADILTDHSGEIRDVVVETSPNLYLLPSGTRVERPDQVLGRSDIREVMDEVTVIRSGTRRQRPRNDENGNAPRVEPEGARPAVYSTPNVTLVDSPAVLGAAEVSALARAVDGVVLVLQAGVSRREAASRAAEQIRRAGGTIIGIVLVGVRTDDYSAYPPIEDFDGTDEDSTWSKVVGTLRR